MGQAVLTVELLGIDKEEALISALSRDKRAGPVHPVGDGKYEFAYDGEAAEAADLLKRLVQAGLPVSAFFRKKEGLEELFLKVGARELS
jgi:ABC-2 type transport system ATP-binding protein